LHAVNANIVTMTLWIPDLEGRRGPKYLALADALADDVAKGALAPGERLPTHRDLAWRLGVTVTTITRAYQEARRRGLIDGEVGRGTFVRDNRKTVLDNQRDLVLTDEGSAINMAGNRPPMLGQTERFAETLRNIAEMPDLAALLAYQPLGGTEAHKTVGLDWLARCGVSCSMDQLVVTNGAQHAMDLTMGVVAKPGDVLLTEVLTYPALKAMAERRGLRLRGVAMDDDGLQPAALEEAIRVHKPKALYVLPNLQNPTARTMPDARRRRIATICEAHALPTIEDDIFARLDPNAPPPLTNFMDSRGIYITSVSKSLGPGLRVGFLKAHPDIASEVSAAVRMTCWMVPPLMIEVVRRWLDDGTADDVMERRREMVLRRRAMADEILGPVGMLHRESHPWSTHLWLPLPEGWTSNSFAAAAERRGALVLPSENFAIEPFHAPRTVRVSLSTVQDENRLQEGLEILAEILRKGPERHPLVM
jgi:DNA-binding transcriptional MocR family regulator